MKFVRLTIFQHYHFEKNDIRFLMTNLLKNDNFICFDFRKIIFLNLIVIFFFVNNETIFRKTFFDFHNYDCDNAIVFQKRTISQFKQTFKYCIYVQFVEKRIDHNNDNDDSTCIHKMKT